MPSCRRSARWCCRDQAAFIVYWISDRPLTKDEWQPFADGLYAETKKHGFKADPVTTDSVRILRVPGTFNYKGGSAKGVRLAALAETELDFEKVFAHVKAQYVAVTGPVTSKPVGLLYQQALFPQRAPLAPTEPSLADGIHVGDDTPLDYAEVVKNCPHFLEAAQTNGAGMEQGLWMLDMLACTFMQDGPQLAHYLSRGYKTYSAGETDKMYERKVRERAERGLGWPSCEAFENAGCKQCATCIHKGVVKSPLNLALPIISAPPFLPLMAKRRLWDACLERSRVEALIYEHPASPLALWHVPHSG